MYQEQLIRHFQDSSRAGIVPPPAITVRVENPVCGDILELSGLLEADVLKTVGFRVRGCTASIAAGSATAAMLEGKTLEQASRIDSRTVEEELGGLETASKHAARLAADGIALLIATLRKVE
jgi:nitrogen fixation NifU-like protein